MSNEEANELWDEIGKRATVRSKAAATRSWRWQITRTRKP